MSGGTMKDNSTTATPEAWKMRFLANGTSGTWFYTDDITVTDAWLRAHPDDVEVILSAGYHPVSIPMNNILKNSVQPWPGCCICII
ncbi:hypothetical protein MUTS15_59440 [Escherichia coli]|nr:hypothetical protein MUTS15_59440 [Escherichia coli]BDZ05827.1 hypothetical protein MUTS16_69000 [Escherichia coli]